MMVKNYYPEKPIIAFYKKQIEMGAIVSVLKTVPYSAEIKRTAYVIIRNETANGKSVIGGTNVSGVQSDGGRWPSKWDGKIVAICEKKENGTGKMRGFVIFDSLESGISFLCDRIQFKGLFIGEQVNGKYHKGDVTTPEELADAYQDEWVKGYDHHTTAIESKNFVSMYNQAKAIFI
jgi:hypothetical protein